MTINTMTINELIALKAGLEKRIDLPSNLSQALLACYCREIELVKAHIATLDLFARDPYPPMDGDRAAIEAHERATRPLLAHYMKETP